MRTEWRTDDIWLQRRFRLDGEKLKLPLFQMHHDEDVEVYLNGVLAARLPGFTTDYEEYDIDPAAAATLKPGENTLAVHCHQTVGGQYIDVGLISMDASAPVGSSPPGK